MCITVSVINLSDSRAREYSLAQCLPYHAVPRSFFPSGLFVFVVRRTRRAKLLASVLLLVFWSIVSLGLSRAGKNRMRSFRWYAMGRHVPAQKRTYHGVIDLRYFNVGEKNSSTNLVITADG